MELDKKSFSIRRHITLVLTLLTVLIVLLIGVCVAVVREQSRIRLTSAADSYLSLLTRTLENLDRVNDILEELGGRIEPLHEQAQSALKYQELSGKLKTLEMNIFLLKNDKLAQRMQELSETIEALRDAIDPALPLGLGEVPYGPLQVMHLQADTSTLQEDTGWRPATPFEEGIRETIEWVRKETK